MTTFIDKEPTVKGFYLVKNDSFEMAAELVMIAGELAWNTTEHSVIVHGGWIEGTTFKRLSFNA